MSKEKKKKTRKKPAGDEAVPAPDDVQGVGPGESTDDTGEPMANDSAAGEVEASAEELIRERDALADRLLRLQADFENFKRRTHRERAELARRAAEDLMTELLPILDHFELGFENAASHEANPAVVEGFRIVYEQMIAGLRKHGLEPVDAVGKFFDPHLHEAITHMPSGDHPADIVIQQTRCGYLLGERLLRAAQVVASSGPPDEEPGVAAVNDDHADSGEDDS